MQLGPVVEIVEVDRIEDRAVIAHAGGGEDAAAGCVGVVIAADGGVGGVDLALGERAAALNGLLLLHQHLGPRLPGGEVPALAR